GCNEIKMAPTLANLTCSNIGLISCQDTSSAEKIQENTHKSSSFY
uniref:Uncharacterized protein n=1 Tax=Amphimedon queenslandica TaxID=400682 RepID=A0A1X7TLQ8_AMPQE